MTVEATNLILAAYPVGSIYMSVNSTDPGTLFGGTWERITGRFLLGATDGGSTGTNVLKTASAAAGATGGEAAHTLQQSEIANHGHGFTQPSVSGGGHSHPLRQRDNSGSSTGYSLMNENGKWKYSDDRIQSSTGTHSHTVSGGAVKDMTGGGGSHNTMPPFLAVYIWKRTA